MQRKGHGEPEPEAVEPPPVPTVGRATSRVIREAIPTEEELMAALDPRYFEADFDPTLEVRGGY